MSTRRINVAIVGCGRIGTQWDGPASAGFAKTHAAAFSRNRQSDLIAVCDHHAASAQSAAKRWGCRAYEDGQEMLSRETIDLLVIAASTAARISVIETALAKGVKFFVIEKPLANSVSEARAIVSALARSGARAIVNFSRRWDTAMCDLRQRLLAGEFGRLQRLVGFYGKGIANNGSHMIDLVSMLCKAVPVRTRSLGSPLPYNEGEWSLGDDRALDAQLVLADQGGTEYQLDLLGTDQSAFTCFELRIIGETGTCTVAAGGRLVEVSRIIDDPAFANYRIPGAAVVTPSRALESMELMAAEAIALVMGQIDRISCDVSTALTTAATVEAIRQSQVEQGRWVRILTGPDST